MQALLLQSTGSCTLRRDPAARLGKHAVWVQHHEGMPGDFTQVGITIRRQRFEIPGCTGIAKRPEHARRHQLYPFILSFKAAHEILKERLPEFF